MDEKILKLIINIKSREKIFLAVLVLLVLGLVFYQAALAPYGGYLRSTRQEYKTQKELLNLKVKKVASLTGLKRNVQDYENLLARVDRHFFTEEELAGFMGDLPTSAARAQNQVTSLRPLASIKNLRTEMVGRFISGLSLSDVRAKEIRAYLQKNRALIDSSNAPELLKDLLGKIPSDKQELLRGLWFQAQDDPLAALKMKKIDLEVMTRGSYQGLVALFDWLTGTGKLMELKELQVVGLSDKTGVETRMILSIYQIQ